VTHPIVKSNMADNECELCGCNTIKMPMHYGFCPLRKEWDEIAAIAKEYEKTMHALGRM
jgi:hypothetical protein